MKSILIRMAWMSFLLILFVPGITLAETKTFIREYSCSASSKAESKDAIRTVARREVKRLLMEALAAHLESKPEMRNSQLQKDQIAWLVAGIVQTDIVEEQWDDRGYLLKSKITADADFVVRSVEALRQDRQKRKELENVGKRSDELLKATDRLCKATAEPAGAEKQRDKTSLLKIIQEIEAIEHFEEGHRYLVAKRWKESLRSLTSAVELDPQFSEAYGNRGVVHEELGDIKRAIQDYNRALELNPQSAIAYNNRGIADGKLGNHKQAIVGYDKAVWLDPQYANAYGNRGNAYRKLGKARQAISDYSKVIELNPQLALAYFLRGGTYASLGEQNQANADFKTAAGLGHKKAQHHLKKQGMDWIRAVPETKTQKDFPRQPVQKSTTPPVTDQQPPLNMEIQAKPPSAANPRYRSIKAIVLHNGEVIEGRIMILNAETVKIYTHEGKILSYSFEKDIKTFLKNDQQESP